MKSIATGVAVVLMFTATAATADCPIATSGTGHVHTLAAANKGDVDLILSMSMMPKLMHLDYAKAKASNLPCDLGSFDAASTTYQLRASREEAGTARVAIPADKKAPIAQLVPVTNLMQMIEASKQGKAAGVSGYMLVTMTKAEITGWRLYDGIPDQQTLTTDMTAALAGTLRPVFRNNTATGKNDIFVPSSS